MSEGHAEKGEVSEPHQSIPYLEVSCKSSGKLRRFAAGTEAGYALLIINLKRGSGVPQALHIEAVKEGEEPVTFGPNSVLVHYGEGWKLQTVPEGYEEMRGAQSTAKLFPTGLKPAKSFAAGEAMSRSQATNSFLYIGKILLAFVFMFLLGGLFTYILENLPDVIKFVTSST